MKKLYVILGNGFTIDFLQYYAEIDPQISDKIDVRNLFRLGDRIDTPWDDRPGFLSYKYCPSLWTLGARPGNTSQESTALIEEIITCANMFFDFINEPAQKAKRVKMVASNKDRIYLNAYCELIVYLRHLFSCYNDAIPTDKLDAFLSGTKWGWVFFLKSVVAAKKYDRITFVTYNYDIWLERILLCLKIPFSVKGLEAETTPCIDIIKPHGSISFVPKSITTTYSVNYNLDFEGASIDQFELKYNDLNNYETGAIIPPAGDSIRLYNTAPWSKHLREAAKSAAMDISEKDEVVLCGISYWHVDRRELDELLLNLNQDSGFTFINPAPPRDLNAVLISIFKNYVHQNSSSEIGGILNG